MLRSGSGDEGCQPFVWCPATATEYLTTVQWVEASSIPFDNTAPSTSNAVN